MESDNQIIVETKEEDKAFMLDSVPANPRPFIKRIQELVDIHGSDVCKTWQYRANVLVLNIQSQGNFTALLDYSHEYFFLQSEYERTL